MTRGVLYEKSIANEPLRTRCKSGTAKSAENSGNREPARKHLYYMHNHSTHARALGAMPQPRRARLTAFRREICLSLSRAAAALSSLSRSSPRDNRLSVAFRCFFIAQEVYLIFFFPSSCFLRVPITMDYYHRISVYSWALGCHAVARWCWVRDGEISNVRATEMTIGFKWFSHLAKGPGSCSICSLCFSGQPFRLLCNFRRERKSIERGYAETLAKPGRRW